ncbi:MAG TPA: TIGR03668 family PPOX class F420-dependent oxidoreductase [Mycobacterium sp.]|nr:TIGR03668 family PPOX class F420-dependent oxidoreductase [Mycobacterium sp.]
MAEFDARQRFADSQVAYLATVSPDAAPHLVPVVFAVAHDVVYTAVDTKRKTTHRLRRLVNVEQNPNVCLLTNHYADDWDQLWWVRADGVAEIYDRGEQMATGYDLLRRKYPQYQRLSLTGPVMRIQISRWSSWHA